MNSLDITAEEIVSRRMTPEHLAEAVRALTEEGYVVLNDVVDIAHLDILRDRMLADVQAFLARDDAPFNFNTSNLQQDPPPFPPYLFRDVLLNDMAIAVTKAILGKGVKNTYYSGNTALHSTQRQPVHADMGQLWKGLEETKVPPAYALVVNVPVVDISPLNGSTELWPGTHKDPHISVHDDIKISPEDLEIWRAKSPPFQPTMKRGGILIRDICLWHAGMPNQTEQPRPMIAMIHYAWWMETHSALQFPKGTEAFFADSDLKTPAAFVEGPIDYVHAPQAYDYQK
jgi:ectoine hydroxylase-related dioxygenase (phytanoyl-CoA dioxygenase family)